MAQYAQKTTVTKNATLAELEVLLGKHGATTFVAGTDKGIATIAFEVRGLRVLMRIPLPDPNEERFTHTPTGRQRHRDTIHADYQAAIRATWRALLLFVKAKLVAIDQGLSTIEQEFLPYILLPGGQTFGDNVLPKIHAAYAAGEVPELLPGTTRLALEGGN
jgi:hypothetical protein